MAQNRFLFSDYDDDNGGFHRAQDFFGGDKKKSDSETKPEQAKAKKKKQSFSVTQLTRLIKVVLAGQLPGRITLEGEISNLTRHGSGHLYCSLKDEEAIISAVMWRSAAEKLKFKPENGLAVIARGRVDVYEPSGKYQFYIDKLEPAGQGGLELAFRQLAEKLRKEGLFAAEHKKSLPRFPSTIAIVTSGTGAAIEDISKTLHRRWPIVRKVLYPVKVQGPEAVGEIIRAIRYFNKNAAKLGGVDVMIVGRGGGSLEDLQAFNDEAVARAIFASAIPIISAVGHEIDTSIADMVADKRAITPTAAAELAVPVMDELRAFLVQTQQRLKQILLQRLEHARQSLARLKSRGIFQRPEEMVLRKHQMVDELASKHERIVLQRLHEAGSRLNKDMTVLGRIEPHAALARAAGQLAEHGHKLTTTIDRYTAGAGHRLEKSMLNLRAISPRGKVADCRTKLSHLQRQLDRTQRQLGLDSRSKLENAAARMESLNPKAVLRRGYSITRNISDKRIVTAKNPPANSDRISTELAGDLIIQSEVSEVKVRKDKDE